MSATATAVPAPPALLAPAPPRVVAKTAGKAFSPSPYMIAGYVTILLAFGVFGSWAATAPLASGIVSNGTVAVQSNKKVIQHLEGGIVSQILVQEGSIVQAGDVLVRLDETQAQSSYNLIQTKVNVLRATEARLLAETLSADKVAFPDDLKASTADLVMQAIKLEQTRFDDRKRTKDGLIAIQNARIEQLNSGIAGDNDQLAATQSQLDLIKQEIARLTEGQATGAVATNQVSQLTRSSLELEGQKGGIMSDLAKQRQTITEAQLQILQVQQDYLEKAGNDLRDTRDQLSDAQEKATVARDILARTVIRAPVRGMVQDLQVHTTGGVIRAAEPIMDIIPIDDGLFVSAQVRPVDIDSVAAGMKAEVKFPAFSTRTTPVIFGTVKVVSQDVVEPTRQGQEPYYLAQIAIADDQVPDTVRGRLLPGMPAEVIISTGERTFLQYLLKPLEDSFSKGMKEK